MSVILSGWCYDEAGPDVTMDDLVSPTFKYEQQGVYHQNEIEYRGYTARFTHVNAVENEAEIEHSVLDNDLVEVRSPSGNVFTCSRTRYRSCCNPLFFEYTREPERLERPGTYVIVNTGLRELTVYNADTGAVVSCTKYAPEMMVAMYYDKAGQSLHLFGWMWQPTEIYCEINISRLFK
jgi:hypothetical protein